MTLTRKPFAEMKTFDELNPLEADEALMQCKYGAAQEGQINDADVWDGRLEGWIGGWMEGECLAVA